MAATVLGRKSWSGRQDEDGHRSYDLRLLVKADDPEAGPYTVFGAAGAPAVGSAWNFGDDNDPDAFCWPAGSVQPVVNSPVCIYWYLDMFFSTRPIKRCQTTSITNPLAEPQKVSGSFVKYTKEAECRADGSLILSSSHERIRGIEQDRNRPSVIVEQNVSGLGLDTFSQMIDTLNDATLWGLPAGCIKLSNAPWDRKLYGTCTYYYTRRFEFDIRYEGFDVADVADAGYKKYDLSRGDTPFQRTLPDYYILARDRRGDSAPQKVLLDGTGDPLVDPTSPVFLDPIALYPRTNFLTLGIPTSF